MHVLLALAAAHRRVTSGNYLQSREELAHWTSAVSISGHTLDGKWDKEADAVLTTSIFLGMLSFLDEHSLLVGDSELAPASFSWFKVQIGLVPLLSRASERASSSVVTVLPRH